MNGSAIALPPAPLAPGKNQLLFRIYLLYRVLLGVVFLLLLTLPTTRALVGSDQPTLYAAASLGFLLSNLAVLGSGERRVQDSNVGLVLMFAVDILCITLVSDASGGMSSGLPLLLTVTIASSAVLISKHSIATLVAALAVLATLLDTLRLISTGAIGFDALFPAGLLGMLFFVVSGIVQIVALRLGRAEAMALERADDLYRLQRLNEQIVQNMQTGILLIDDKNSVRVLNGAAGRLLDPTRPLAIEQGRSIADYSEELAERLDNFLRTGDQRGAPFRIRNDGTELVARFQSLAAESQAQTLVFLEDYRPITAYAQSLKLSSLGRLAGSIAHEIRNPLGAISHASQLLQESATLDTDDRHLVSMILTNSHRVNEIVESVLQISRREPPRPETLGLATWINSYRERYQLSRDAGGEVVIEYVDRGARIVFDPEHLGRILDNLIDNALRHSEGAGAGRRAELRIRVDRGRGECVLDIYDEGKGVAEADIPRLFEPFFTRSKGGSGLGLYLCRELCELNQSRIAYAPTSDGRSRFQITIRQQE
ncbi:MAG: HAMP domain-containing sensor histidine kinase [Halieaceae bacterium]|nr:HAMP domain-containing sensor histidine kinase [Halieaceae bacterium]